LYQLRREGNTGKDETSWEVTQDVAGETGSRHSECLVPHAGAVRAGGMALILKHGDGRVSWNAWIK